MTAGDHLRAWLDSLETALWLAGVHEGGDGSPSAALKEVGGCVSSRSYVLAGADP